DMDEALDIADEIILMKDGKIEQTGSPMALLEEPKNEFVAQFIGEERVYRRLGFAKRKLQDFSAYFLQTTEKAATSIKAEATLEEALQLLKTNDTLAVIEEEKTQGYITEGTLLEIAFKGSEHHEYTIEYIYGSLRHDYRCIFAAYLLILCLACYRRAHITTTRHVRGKTP